MIWPQAKGCHRLLAATRRSQETSLGQTLPQSPQKEPTLPTFISDFWPPELSENKFLLF